MEFTAAYILRPERLELRRAPCRRLGPCDVLARVAAVGICGTDIGIYEGTLPYFRTGLMRYPVVPGHEWAGEVVEVGKEVRRVRPGDRVTAECHIGCGSCRHCLAGRYNLCPTRTRVGLMGLDGACAEQVVVPDKAVHPLPAGLDTELGALVEPATIAFRALEKALPLAGRRLVVLGAGPVGLLVAALARAQGAVSVAVAGLEEERLRVARALGCDATFGPADGDLEQALRAATAGEGADAVIEATGDARLIPTALAVAAPGADVVLLSLYKERPVTLVADAIVSKDLTIHGSIASPGVWERTLRLLGGLAVDLRPMISHRFPLAQADAAFQTARQRDSGAIKVLILPHASGVGEVHR